MSPHRNTAAPTRGVTIRPDGAGDALALRRLAALDSAEIPSGALLLAEVSGELWAAVPLSGGAAVADPFRPTAELVSLLRVRADQVRRAERSTRAPRGLTRLAPWRWRGATR